MARTTAEKYGPMIFRLYAELGSTRKVSRALKDAGIELGHTRVWEILWSDQTKYAEAIKEWLDSDADRFQHIQDVGVNILLEQLRGIQAIQKAAIDAAAKGETVAFLNDDGEAVSVMEALRLVSEPQILRTISDIVLKASDTAQKLRPPTALDDRIRQTIADPETQSPVEQYHALQKAGMKLPDGLVIELVRRGFLPAEMAGISDDEGDKG